MIVARVAVEELVARIIKGYEIQFLRSGAMYAKEDVLNAARKCIRPENMQFVLPGEEAFALE